MLTHVHVVYRSVANYSVGRARFKNLLTSTIDIRLSAFCNVAAVDVSCYCNTWRQCSS